MRRLYKKIISFFVSLVMVLSFTSTSYAMASTGKVVNIDGTVYSINTNTKGVTTVFDRTTGALAVYDERTGILTVKESATSAEIIINIRGLSSDTQIMAENSSSDNKYSYSNSTKYYNGKPYTFWQIQIPDQIKYTYEKNNATNLYNFQLNVDNMRSAQDAIGLSVGSTGLAIILGIVAVTSVSGLAAAILAVASILGGGSSIYDFIDYATTIKNCQNNCVTYFNSVVPVSIP